jgi:hypothetical protein
MAQSHSSTDSAPDSTVMCSAAQPMVPGTHVGDVIGVDRPMLVHKVPRWKLSTPTRC